MTGYPESPILRYTRRLDEKVDRPADGLSDVKTGLRGVTAHGAGFTQSDVARDGAMATIRDRPTRTTSRLGLTERME